MSNPFFDHPILNSPYVRPLRHWELDAEGQPTQKIIETRRRAEFITPIPKPKTRKGSPAQQKMVFDEGRGLSDAKQEYDPTSIINELRQRVDQWRALPNPAQWLVTPETVRLPRPEEGPRRRSFHRRKSFASSCPWGGRR
jgi:type III restriction enzyme